MPYKVGDKGSYGCSGYPAIKDDGEVMGCHDTAEAAGRQIAAIEANENKSVEWETVKPIEETSGFKKNKRYSVRENYAGCDGYAIVEVDEDGEEELEGCYETRAEAEAAARMENSSEDTEDLESNPETENTIMSTIGKQETQITEGDFVTAMTTEGIVVGQVEHVMREGGTYGEPGNPYAVESTPENPAVAIRILKEDDSVYYYTPYSIGAKMSDIQIIDRPNIAMKEEDKGMGIKDPEKWPETKRDGGKFPSSMGQPHAASNGESVVKEPKKKPKRSRGGVGGDPTGAITAGSGGMSTKSDEEKTDAELFAGFGKDFTRVDRRLEVFLPESD